MAARVLAAILIAAALAGAAHAESARTHGIECTFPPEIVRLGRPLKRFLERITSDRNATILAIGSSSTAGAGASRPERAYPSRLGAELRGKLPAAEIKVVNRGVGGEDARDMLARFDRDLVPTKPDLVLWQVGTNALLRSSGISGEAPLIREGLRRIRATGADAILIDPQYAPVVLADPDARPMVDLLGSLGREAGVPVFRRFALMQYWHEEREISFAYLLSPDLFHMNDWSYACWAKAMATAIARGDAGAPEAPGVATARPPIAPGTAALTPASAR